MTDIIERFTVHKDHEWALIYLDEEKGMFFAYSSFGSFAHCWYSRGGQPLKQFLRDLGYDYFMRKTHGLSAYEFDIEGTARGMKQYIIEQRRQNYIDKSFARMAWSSVEDIENERPGAEAFATLVYSDRTLGKLYDWDFCDITRQRDNPQCRGFWDVIWPEFLKQIEPQPATEAA